MNETFTYRFGKDTAFNCATTTCAPRVTLRSESTVGHVEPALRRHKRSTGAAVAPWCAKQLRFCAASEGSVGWSPVGIRAEYSPHDYLSAAHARDVRPVLQGGCQLPTGRYLSARSDAPGNRRQIRQHEKHMGRNRRLLEQLEVGPVKTDFRMSYNGYSQQFNSIQASIIYDLHCAEAVAQIVDNPIGFQNGTSFVFFIRIKGLPFDTSFGNGTRGQPFGYGTGVGY